MRILWLCNVPLPKISIEMGLNTSPFGGWLVSAADYLIDNGNELFVCFPVYNHSNAKGRIGNLHYYAYKENAHKLYEYRSDLCDSFQNCIKQFNPDVIHIWGTEYPRSLAMVNAATKLNLNRLVVSIQGICNKYASHYFAGLPNNIIKRYTIRDFIRRDNLFNQYKKFCIQALYEKEIFEKTKHIIGRTTWDRACSEEMAPQAEYHYCAETLRPSFYRNKWSYENCEKHSIFVSQSSYPIKGFHIMLEAMPEILKYYPDAQLKTTGTDPRKLSSLKKTSYQKYIEYLIKKYELGNNVQFLGLLDEHEMCNQYLNCNVFVSPSSIENSPNSVGEAMLLGVPTVASYVGGTMDMLVDKEEGFLFQQDASYMISYYVKNIFGDSEKASSLGEKAREHAIETHDIGNNMVNLISIYNYICANEESIFLER